ncbi:hypothetical protein [Amycolatopsis taiwanensis]|uniref:MmyB-like transcription regulator ligand binding domain-containing protein n=1 Tax=Amycolatopsis taiwanensis TaxID=342230 RepID=A0A9W6QYE9_9PSEU|nr:hypothetical protein [Amycolatopsis taiwanensis]GLY66311.1 hypothetical protein Atai01_29300 [Amycolatopsis taiwanensis]
MHQDRPVGPTEIALPVRIRHRGVELCFVNTITTFGAAFDITLEEIAVEACFPADAETARFFQAGNTELSERVLSGVSSPGPVPTVPR